jgi:hypothetical protein
MKYQCETCGMGVEGLKCVKCGCELIHGHIEKNNQKIAVAKCRMIKSPQCCGHDMACELK